MSASPDHITTIKIKKIISRKERAGTFPTCMVSLVQNGIEDEALTGRTVVKTSTSPEGLSGTVESTLTVEPYAARIKQDDEPNNIKKYK
jgi:hypothetical protein